MESRQSRKSGNRPRVCRTCGQHHSHHEPHIYDYKEEVSSSTYRIPVEKLSLKIQSKVLQQRKDPHSKWLVPSFVIGLTRRITTSSRIIVFLLPSSWYWYWYIDIDIDIDVQVDEDLMCQICLQPFVSPTDTPCSHTFCQVTRPVSSNLLPISLKPTYF